MNVHNVEAFLVRKALLWIKEHGLEKIIIELDSMEVFSALVRSAFNFLDFGVILGDYIALRNQYSLNALSMNLRDCKLG